MNLSLREKKQGGIMKQELGNLWKQEERWILKFSQYHAWKVLQQGLDASDLYQEMAVVFLNCRKAYPEAEGKVFHKVFRRSCTHRMMDLAGRRPKRIFEREYHWLGELEDVRKKVDKKKWVAERGFREVDLKLDCKGAWDWLRDDLLKALDGITLNGRKYPRKRKGAQRWCRDILHLSPV